MGKRFLLFLPDSHSAYYNSFVSALGQSLPPTGSFKDLLYLKKKKVSGGWGGGWVVGSPTWERVWDFSALGGLTSSVSRRVVKLTVSKREAMGTKSETLSCS